MPRIDLRPEALLALRRTDWRFLLPDREMGRVAVLAAPLADEPDDALMSGIEQLAGAVDTIRGTEGLSSAAHDLVVACNPSPAGLKQAARSTDTGGVMYVELHRPQRRARLGGLARWQRAMNDTGTSLISAHWHHPSFDADEIVPLSRGSVQMALGRRRGSLARSVAAGAAARTPWAHAGIGRAAPAVSLLGAAPRSGDGAASWLLRSGSTSADVRPGTFPWLLVTPRFATSRHVVLLAGPDRRGGAAWVAKTPRIAADTAALHHEAGILGALTARVRVSGAFPRLLSFEAGPPAVLVETALVGRPLDPLAVRRSPDRALRLGANWVRTIAGAAGPAQAGRFTALVSSPLDSLSKAPFAIDPDRIRRARGILEALDTSRVPTVIEHGDMSHPNLVVQRDRLGLIDWELGTDEGLPLGDLAFFIGYLAFARARATSPETHAEALRAAMGAQDRWGMRVLREHAKQLGLPASLVGPLVLAAWTRYAASIGQRVVSDDAAASAQVARFTAAWRQVLAIVDAPS
jgi:hypothetical protein